METLGAAFCPTLMADSDSYVWIYRVAAL